MPENRAERRLREAGERRQVFVPREEQRRPVFVPRPQWAIWDCSATNTSTESNSIFWATHNLTGSSYHFSSQWYARYTALASDQPDPAALERQRAFHIERERAIERAEVLLIENLSAHQLQEYRDRGTFVVATDNPPRLFRLQKRRVANILELNPQGSPIARYCVHPHLDCPDADTMLAQKLWLENNPEELLSIANRHPI